MPVRIYDLAKKLGVKFNNIELLQQAVTHRSYLNEHRGYRLDHNERLEFLGDAVLELVATEYLYKNYPHPEGELTNFRSALVNYKMLSDIAKRLGLATAVSKSPVDPQGLLEVLEGLLIFPDICIHHA